MTHTRSSNSSPRRSLCVYFVQCLALAAIVWWIFCGLPALITAHTKTVATLHTGRLQSFTFQLNQEMHYARHLDAAMIWVPFWLLLLPVSRLHYMVCPHRLIAEIHRNRQRMCLELSESLRREEPTYHSLHPFRERMVVWRAIRRLTAPGAVRPRGFYFRKELKLNFQSSTSLIDHGPPEVYELCILLSPFAVTNVYPRLLHELAHHVHQIHMGSNEFLVPPSTIDEEKIERRVRRWADPRIGVHPGTWLPSANAFITPVSVADNMVNQRVKLVIVGGISLSLLLLLTGSIPAITILAWFVSIQLFFGLASLHYNATRSDAHVARQRKKRQGSQAGKSL